MQSKRQSSTARELETLVEEMSLRGGFNHDQCKSIARALSMCKIAHAKQMDRDDLPHSEHCIRVALKQNQPVLIIIALLHDILEDTNITIKEIELAFSLRVASAIEHLTKRKNEQYPDYIERVRKNHDAIVVKIADIEDNMLRIEPERTRKIQQYLSALDILQS